MERLFEEPPKSPASAADRHEGDGPLAARMRPRSLAEVIGQEHLLGSDSQPTALRRCIESGEPHSMILYGPPGSGKTTLARLVATTAKAAFEEASAVEVGRPQVRAMLERAAERRGINGGSTIFFLDEIHRFNKAQQDTLLPAVEEGLVTLIGATTENPFFEVNAALLSRAHIYELQPLDYADVRALLERAVARGECGEGRSVEADALDFLAAHSDGDARAGLSALEIACASAPIQEAVTLGLAEEALQRRPLRFDKDGDQHYDFISAWIKATRASDPDASLYYLAIMLEGGEDPRFIARRMVIFASEDIGNADPRALEIAVAAAQAVEHAGLPECQFALAQAAIYLSITPKSNAATTAIFAARAHVREHGAKLPPSSMRSSAYAGAKKLGRGQDYQSPHSSSGHISSDEVMPAGLEGVRFYAPDQAEERFATRLAEIR
ncbi:MAG: replication-associated recombination protein A, partial [Actinomycetota bacterium]